MLNSFFGNDFFELTLQVCTEEDVYVQRLGFASQNLLRLRRKTSLVFRLRRTLAPSAVDPSKIKKGTCKDNKTIDFNPANSAEDLSYHEYSAIEEKKPRYFQLARYKGKYVTCEKTKIPYKVRLKKFCGKTICDRGEPSTKQCVSESNYRKCRSKLPPSCDLVAQRNKEINSDPDVCVSLVRFKEASKKLLLSNPSLLLKYCPDDCSYYTQVVQRVYKKGIKGKYCSDNYLIVHCGPKRDGSTYNLNIKEIKDICSDLSIPSCRAFVKRQTEYRLL